MSESQTETAASTPLVSSIEDIPAELVERIKARILAEVTTELRDSNNETESNFSASESDEAIKESNEHNYLELINESERIGTKTPTCRFRAWVTIPLPLVSLTSIILLIMK